MAVIPRIQRAVPKGSITRPAPPGLPVFARLRWHDGRDTDPLRGPSLHERGRRHHRHRPGPIIHHPRHQHHPQVGHRPGGIFPPAAKPRNTTERSMNSSNDSTRPDGHAHTPGSSNEETGTTSPSKPTDTNSDPTTQRS